MRYIMYDSGILTKSNDIQGLNDNYYFVETFTNKTNKYREKNIYS